MKSIVFFDLEVNPQTGKLFDSGAIDETGTEFHKNSINELAAFLQRAEFIAGHNIFAHDLPILKKHAGSGIDRLKSIDTLLLSPLLFPKIPYHALLKDEKLLRNTETGSALAGSERPSQSKTSSSRLLAQLFLLFFKLNPFIR